jgi:hypothetical protein
MVRQVMDAAVLGLENAHIDHELLGEYTCTYMNRDSDFIKYATFVEAIENIQFGNEENLTIDEKTTVKALILAPEVEDVLEEDSDEIESAMSNLKPTASDTPRTKRKKRQKLASLRANDRLKKDKTSTQAKGKSLYIPLGFILGTNNTLECFFGRCKHVLTGDRSSMSPFMFEFIMFLKNNSNLLGVLDMAKAIAMDIKENYRYMQDYPDTQQDGN